MATKLTIASVRAELRTLGMTLYKVDGEYSVNFLGAAESSKYFTTDLSDALGTARLMARRAELAEKEFEERSVECARRNAEPTKIERIVEFAESVQAFLDLDSTVRAHGYVGRLELLKSKQEAVFVLSYDGSVADAYRVIGVAVQSAMANRGLRPDVSISIGSGSVQDEHSIVISFSL